VHMLVRVDVGETESVALKKGDLRGRFSFDFGRADAGGVEALEKRADGGVEPACIAVDEGRNPVGIGRRDAVDKDDVTADAEGGHGERHLHGFFSGCGPGHERCAGKDLRSVELEYGAVDSGSHPEIVGVHDEARHGDSLSTL
jgi:hypothetical protein